MLKASSHLHKDCKTYIIEKSSTGFVLLSEDNNNNPLHTHTHEGHSIEKTVQLAIIKLCKAVIWEQNGTE